MKTINDFKHVKIGSIIGAVAHHKFFMSNWTPRQNIKAAASAIKERGLGAYISSEYPNPGAMSKNIIINNIAGRLFMTDGNKHSISMVLADENITIGDLLGIEPRLFRYWEEGYEKGGDTRYQPYVTYIPIEVDVTRIAGVSRGVDNKGYKINIIASNIAYDSAVFTEQDRGRTIFETARAISGTD